MVYTLLLERIERQVASERQVAAVFMAAGAKKVKLPDYESERSRFDAALVAEPKAQDVATRELLQVLGVA